MSVLSSLSNLLFNDKHSDALHLGIGYELKDYRRERLRDLYQFNKNRKGHTFVAGTTRVGKTRLLQNMIVQDIRAGRSVGLIDPKGDWEIWEAMVQEAYRAGREKELTFISPYYPQYSAPVNALSRFMFAEEPINHIVAGVPNDDEFFYKVAVETTTVIVRTLLLQKRYEDRPTGALTFEEVYALASYDGILKCREILKPLSKTNEKEVAQLQVSVEHILGSERDYFSKISTTLRTTLTQMTIGQTGEIMGNVKENDLIERLESGKRAIFYAQTGSMLTNEVSKVMSRVLVSMMQALAGRLYARKKTLETPLCLYMDEFSNMVYLGIENLFNKGGGANFILTAATQSFADVEAVVGEQKARMISDNTNTKIFMRVNDLVTAETMARYGGVKRKYSYIFSSHGGITTRVAEDDIIKAGELLKLQPREFYYFGLENIGYFGKSAPVKPVEIQIDMSERKGEGAGEQPIASATNR
jgi:hypothetical protein